MTSRIFQAALALILLLSFNAQAEVRPWTWMQSTCQNCPISIVTQKPELESQKVQDFIKALEDSKFEITALYHSDPQEYNLLAHMAIGILGRESKFFDSWRYFAKEEMQWAVSIIKSIRVYLSNGEHKFSDNSRGPTQIKVIPELIANHYHITEDDLYVPENAARATMGFLIEALQELKTRAKNNHWDFVTQKTYVDYLPYVYFGATKKLADHTANPQKNGYVKAMKNYMRWVRIYEYTPVSASH